ncbi:FAD-binding protein [Methylogaea oryzae]|uniref:FAD-binding protein n=1 Tax=Methylogaea oryzae TaxID=1295382 RepID=UPI0020D07A0C|nr:NAD(P)/FAD-dependent oxidoreductase [Methylogaea oryzae]
MTPDVIIIGAGASGLMCAMEPANAAAKCWCWTTPTRPAKRSSCPAAAAAISPI